MLYVDEKHKFLQGFAIGAERRKSIRSRFRANRCGRIATFSISRKLNNDTSLSNFNKHRAKHTLLKQKLRKLDVFDNFCSTVGASF